MFNSLPEIGTGLPDRPQSPEARMAVGEQIARELHHCKQEGNARIDSYPCVCGTGWFCPHHPFNLSFEAKEAMRVAGGGQ